MTPRVVRPAAAVWLTRTEGPPGADYEAGLLFRARFAAAAGAGETRGEFTWTTDSAKAKTLLAELQQRSRGLAFSEQGACGLVNTDIGRLRR